MGTLSMALADESETLYRWDKTRGGYVSACDVADSFHQEHGLKSVPPTGFIKGPIPLPWLETAACLPGKVLNTALAIWFVYGLTGQRTFVVKRKTWERLSLTRQAYNRALHALESAQLITVDRQTGRYPIITLITDL